ncbi:hypothetical protein [Pseudanabaena sp. PCC 6802]|uniref:hypothetical protein n=1 Tax=Pseudanabaena sp. PCC 6802 TaxID=118173 RepID=UPI00034966EC|nr:hypothetical protein [Pseudanabaena sp. PCC 6802]
MTSLKIRYQTISLHTTFEVEQRSPEVKACFSFWYLLGKDDEYPLISEFSFDYDLPENKPEDFPSPEAIQGANLFFNNLQKYADWLSSSNSTRTAFATGL